MDIIPFLFWIPVLYLLIGFMIGSFLKVIFEKKFQRYSFYELCLKWPIVFFIETDD